MRVVVGLTSHWSYSAIFCAGLIYLIGRPDEPRRIGRGLFLMLSAMALHGLWDATGGLTGINKILFPIVYIGVPVFAHRAVRVDLQELGRHRASVDARADGARGRRRGAVTG
jgi:RsiW-degrading membrane proteinase PrsW (M82 family)